MYDSTNEHTNVHAGWKYIYLRRGKSRSYLLEFNQFRLHQQIIESSLNIRAPNDSK